MDTNSGKQLIEHERFGHIVYAAGCQPFDHVFCLRKTGHEYHGQMQTNPYRASGACRFQAADPGIRASISTKSGVICSRSSKRRLAVSRNQHREARVIERVGQ